MTFGVHVRDREAAERTLVEPSADLTLVFEPLKMSDLGVLLAARQPVHAVMHPEHPLAREERPRLPTLSGRAERVGQLRIPASLRALAENIVSLQIPLGLPTPDATDGLVSLRIAEHDLPVGSLYVSQWRAASCRWRRALLGPNPGRLRRTLRLPLRVIRPHRNAPATSG